MMLVLYNAACGRLGCVSYNSNPSLFTVGAGIRVCMPQCVLSLAEHWLHHEQTFAAVQLHMGVCHVVIGYRPVNNDRALLESIICGFSRFYVTQGLSAMM
jgi:hypothetical protein